VVGLVAEARIARGMSMVEIGGGLPEGAAEAGERLVARGARALLSFGLAGGLDPALAPGAIVVPGCVVEGDARFAVDAALAAWLGGVTAAAVLAGRVVLADATAKRAAWEATGAAIVDLESGPVARVAARHGMPFAVLRAVCDPAARSLPPAALAALGATGRIGPWHVAASVLRQPGQVPALLALAGDAARARWALVRAVARLGTAPR